jgi:nitrogen regulatory protein P-II 1
MKLIVAIVRAERLSAVLEELYLAEVQGLTISRVQGHGGEREHVETYRGTTVKMELSEKVRVDIGVSNHFVDRTVSAILKAARTGAVGDGKIFVLPVEKVYRIRTGEEDEAAVTPVGVPTTA